MKNHLEFLYQEYSIVKSTVTNMQQENHRLAALCEKLKMAQIDAFKIQREMNDQLESLKTPTTFEAAMMKDPDPNSAHPTSQQPMPSDVVKLIQKFPLLQMKNFHFLFSVQSSWQNLNSQLESERKQLMELTSEVGNLKNMIPDSVSASSNLLHMAESPTIPLAAMKRK